jgi:hypothetical protein
MRNWLNGIMGVIGHDGHGPLISFTSDARFHYPLTSHMSFDSHFLSAAEGYVGQRPVAGRHSGVGVVAAGGIEAIT